MVIQDHSLAVVGMKVHRGMRILGSKGINGGEGGIRTHGGLTPTPDFESGTFDHSATSPQHSSEAELYLCGAKNRLASHVGRKRLRQQNTPIGLLTILKHGNEGPTNRHP